MGDGVFLVYRIWFKELFQFLGLLDLVVVLWFDMKCLLFWEIIDCFGLEMGVVDGYFYSYLVVEQVILGGYFLSYGFDFYFVGVILDDMVVLLLYLQLVDFFGGDLLLCGIDLEWQIDVMFRLFEVCW